MPEALQRNPKTNFNGYLYGHQPLSQSNSTIMPNIQSGGMMASHIDFMNINSSPPLLSGGAQAVYLSNMGGKGGEGMPVLSHGAMYGGMHSGMPATSGSYPNMAAYSGSMDAMTAGGAGVKRSAPSQGGGATNKKAKTSSATNRSRTTSYATAADGMGHMQYNGATSLPPATTPGQLYYSLQPGGQRPAGGPAPVPHPPINLALADNAPQSASATPGAPSPTASGTKIGSEDCRPMQGVTLQSSQAGQSGAPGNYPQLSAAGVAQNQYHRQLPPQGLMQGYPQNMPTYQQYHPPQHPVPSGAGVGNVSAPGLMSAPLSGQDTTAKHPGGALEGQGPNRPALGMPGAQYGQYRPPLMPPALQRGVSNTSMYVPPTGPHNPSPGSSGAPSPHQQFQYQHLSQVGGQQQQSYSQMQQAQQQQHMQMQMHGQYPQQGQWGNVPLQPPVQQHTGPPQVGQVVPQMLLNKGLPKAPRVRNKTPKTGKKALTAANFGGVAAHGSEFGSPGEFSGMGTEAGKAQTYKERRAATSKKALAAAAEAERLRSGDVSVREEIRRKEGKRERDAAQGDAENRPDRDKVEKEESLSALLKRREPVAARLEEIEVSKYLGRKCPPAPLPALVPVIPTPDRIKEEGLASAGWVNHALAPIQCDQRRKTQWDYLLEEVQWMAVDFRQELRWKLASSKALAQACITTSSACMRRRPSAAISRTEADASQARSVAARVSVGVAGYWSAWERSVARQKAASSAPTDNLYAVMEDPQPTGAHVDLGKTTERILQLPSQLSAEGEETKAAASSGAEPKQEKSKGHKTGKSPSRDKAVSASGTEPEFPYALQTHQAVAVHKISALNRLGFGAILGGRSFVGKTVTVCSLLRRWLSPSSSTPHPALVVLTVAPQCLYRWTSQICTVGLAQQYLVWDGKTPDTALPQGALVVAVPSDQLQDFIRSPTYQRLLPKRTDLISAEEGAETASAAEVTAPSHTVTAIVVDLRSTQRRELLGTSPEDDADSLLGQVGRLADHLAPALSARCVITEDASPQDTPLASLWYLCPGTSRRAWQDAYQLQGNLDSQVEQIKRNTLSQLIANLSVVMKMPASADSVVAAQVRFTSLCATVPCNLVHVIC
jgi:hypothetical protein